MPERWLSYLEVEQETCRWFCNNGLSQISVSRESESDASLITRFVRFCVANDLKCLCFMAVFLSFCLKSLIMTISGCYSGSERVCELCVWPLAPHLYDFVCFACLRLSLKPCIPEHRNNLMLSILLCHYVPSRSTL